MTTRSKETPLHVKLYSQTTIGNNKVSLNTRTHLDNTRTGLSDRIPHPLIPFVGEAMINWPVTRSDRRPISHSTGSPIANKMAGVESHPGKASVIWA
ncbi:hypothetical protein BaRGS_00038449, partial [Batillaria attramentaria]